MSDKNENFFTAEKLETLIEYFQTIPSFALSMIAKNHVNVVELAKDELASRGQNEDGKWVGFAKKI